jgi:hypothetical protein
MKRIYTNNLIKEYRMITNNDPPLAYADIILNHKMYLPDSTRESSRADILRLGSPILRPTSDLILKNQKFHVISYFDENGNLTHSLVRYDPLTNRIYGNNGQFLAENVDALLLLFRMKYPMGYPLRPGNVFVGRGGKRRTMRKQKKRRQAKKSKKSKSRKH